MTCSRFYFPDTRQENTRFPVSLSHFLPHRATAVHFSAGPVTEFNSAVNFDLGWKLQRPASAAAYTAPRDVTLHV